MFDPPPRRGSSLVISTTPAPPPLPEPVLLYDTRDWSGAGTYPNALDGNIPNRGTAGADFDLGVYGYTVGSQHYLSGDRRLGAGVPFSPSTAALPSSFWTDIGGAFADEPMTFLRVTGAPVDQYNDSGMLWAESAVGYYGEFEVSNGRLVIDFNDSSSARYTEVSYDCGELPPAGLAIWATWRANDFAGDIYVNAVATSVDATVGGLFAGGYFDFYDFSPASPSNPSSRFFDFLEGFYVGFGEHDAGVGSGTMPGQPWGVTRGLALYRAELTAAQIAQILTDEFGIAP